jgi:hypothetical protein
MNLVFDGGGIVLDGQWNKTEVALIGMAVLYVAVVAFFGWQYWQARLAYKLSLKHQTFWPPATETWLPVDGATITRIDKRKKSA